MQGLDVKPWQVDAQTIRFDQFQDIPSVTRDIEEFMHAPLGTAQKIVVAPKGFGKTLLLRYRAHWLRSEMPSMKFHPSGQDDIEYLRTFLSVEDFSRLLPRLVTPDIWSQLWQCVLLAVGCRTAGIESFVDDVLDDLFEAKDYNISRYLTAAIRAVESWPYLFSHGLEKLLREFNSSGIDAVLVFDNTDEAFKENEIQYDLAQNAPEIWVKAQIGLLLAVRMIERSAKRLHLYTSLRAEATNVIIHEMQEQAMVHCLKLRYTSSQLHEIFLWNIGLYDDQELTESNAKETIAKWLGFDEIAHVNVVTPAGTPCIEDLFNFFLRHTLFSPRDLMMIGNALHVLGEDRTVDAVRSAVNHTATATIFGQWKKAAIPAWSKPYEIALREIESNVIDRSQLDELDELVKNETRNYTRPVQLFSHFLYQHGLLGHVSNAGGVSTQKFLIAWDQRFVGPDQQIPPSDYYLIHPLLIDVIRQQKRVKEFKVTHVNVIGYNKPFVTKNDWCLVVSSDETETIVTYKGISLTKTQRISQYKQALIAILCAIEKSGTTSLTPSMISEADQDIRSMCDGPHWIHKLKDPDFLSHLNSNLKKLLKEDSKPVIKVVRNEGVLQAIQFLLCDSKDIYFDRPRLVR